MTEHRRWPKRGIVLSCLLLLAVFTLSGCRGGSRAASWTGLVVSEGVVYAADLEQVRAFDAESGASLWNFPGESGDSYGSFYQIAVQPGEMLFVTSQERGGGGLFSQPEGMLRAISIDGERVVWSFTDTRDQYAARGAVGDGILVIGNGDGNVYGIRAEDGSSAWTFETGGRVWAPPLIISDTVYIASMDHHLYALDLATGEEVWEEPFEAEGAMTAQPLDLGDRLCLGAFDSVLYALNSEDASLDWRFEGENWFWGSPTSDGDTVYAVDVDGGVYAVDAESGSEKWHEPLLDVTRAGPVLGPEGEVLLVGTNSGDIYGLDTEDGEVLWVEEGEGHLGSMIVVEDTLYVSHIYGENHVQAFRIDEDGLDSLWVYPQPEAEE